MTARAFLSGLAIAAVAASAHGQLSIARPNFGVPEFVEAGGTFRVEAKAAAGLGSGLWSAILVNDLRVWTAAVEQAEYGVHVDNNTLSGYRLTVRVPADVPPEVFRLALSHPSAGTATNRNAVSVLTCIETNFYIFHYADPQGEAYEPSVWDTGMYSTHGSVRELLWHAPAVRLANPRFMFDTGDELDNNYGTSVARYEQYKDGMCQMGVAVLATRGNNDAVAGFSTANWRSTIGVESYSVTMGSFYICQKDYNENNFTAWFTNNYACSFTNAAIGYRLFGQHFNSGGCAWLPPAGQYPSLMLVGHGHVNSTLQSSPYPILETQQACYKGSIGFLQFEKSGGNWSCTTLGSPWAQLMSAGPTSKLTCAYSYANNGSSTTNTASITNSIALRFWDGRIRFLAPYWGAGYQVSGGTKLAEYAYNGGSNVAILVKVDIRASGSTTVAVGQASSGNLPQISNGSGASGISSSSAVLNGNLIATGSLSTDVRVYWGTSNGGTDPALWATGALVGAGMPAGPFSHPVSGLTADTLYHYRCSASNSAGVSWAPSADSFRTTDTVPPVLAITVPTHGAVYRSYVSNIMVGGTVTDGNGVTGISYTITGATAGTGVPVTGAVGLVTAGALWKYRDDGSDQGAAWRGMAFDDTSWPSGRAELGYGDGGETTTNSYGPDPNNRHVTTYYRHSFALPPDPSLFTNGLLALRVRRDDGVVVYLNGDEVYRDNVPGSQNYLTLASGACADDGASWLTAAVPAASLTGGTNVIAAEIHQSAVNSTDISFDLSLTAALGNGWVLPAAQFAGGTSTVSVVAVDAAGNSATATVQIVVSNDHDGDRMDDAWEIANFGDLSIATPSSDRDGDGMPDWHEYVAGTQPTNAQSVLAITNAALSVGGSGIVLHWPSVAGRIYSILGSTNLVTRFPGPVVSGLAATPPSNTRTVDVAEVGVTNTFCIGVQAE